MTRRRDVEQRLRSLSEIRDILAAMKNLSILETRKLSRFIDAQRQVTAAVERVASDFLSFYPQFASMPDGFTSLYVVIGADRGFCGDFNQTLVKALQAQLKSQPAETQVLALGRKLSTLLQGDPHILALVDGPTVVEEVGATLNALVNRVTELQTRTNPLSLYAIHHDNHTGGIAVTPLLPPFLHIRHSTYTDAPLLYLDPGDFFAALIDHYLFAVLHAILYDSLLLEHQRRIQHLEGATRRLDEQVGGYTLQCNALRQEEITEEIEVIMLSAGKRDNHGSFPGL